MLQVRTYVAASSIEGVGLFAAEPIARGAIVWRSDPEFDLAIPETKLPFYPAAVRELLERYAYPSVDRPGLVIYEIDNARFMNHSDRPNTSFTEAGYGTALADIAAGEEMTCDYGEFYRDGFELSRP